MTYEKAVAKYTDTYSKYLETIVVGGSKKVALAYAVKDMINQTKNMCEKDAIFVINDEAEYLLERMA